MKNHYLGLRDGKYRPHNLTDEEWAEVRTELDRLGLKHRADYMNGDITHDEYYRQFATDRTRSQVTNFIGKKALLASTDEHLNDIPLRRWDACPCDSQHRRICGEGFSQATHVCILKAAARMLIEEWESES